MADLSHARSVPLPPQFPRIVINSDGSVTRIPSPMFPEVPPNPNPEDPHAGVASRDIVLDSELGVWVRLFLPLNLSSLQTAPIIVYFHGGGFTLFGAATAQMHTLCSLISSKLPCIVVSVNYRLAPEHRLPAAYDDGCSVLSWLDEARQKKADEIDQDWVKSVDFSKVFVAGDSAGGNLAYQVSIRADELKLGFKLAGQVLLQPFFGGVERSEAELKLGVGPVLTTESCDKCWELALPVGVDRDHEFCNPIKDGRVREVVKKKGSGFVGKTLVVVGGLDMLKDRQVELARGLEAEGEDVKLVVYENGVHGFYEFPGNTLTSLLLDELLSFCYT